MQVVQGAVIEDFVVLSPHMITDVSDAVIKDVIIDKEAHIGSRARLLGGTVIPAQRAVIMQQVITLRLIIVACYVVSR